MTFSFRIRFRLGDGVKIDTDDHKWVLSDVDPSNPVVLVSRDMGISIGGARQLVLRGSGYASEGEARMAGEQWESILRSAFAATTIGADFGDRAPKSAFTEVGLRALEAQHGRRVLNDVHGLMTFESAPQPMFVALGDLDVTIGKPAATVRAAIDLAISRQHSMTARERLAFDLYSASFFEKAADARFLMLMMALETLLEPAPRSDEVRSYVMSLIKAIETSDLETREIRSIVGSLRWLLNESISQAGRRCAMSLGDRSYMQASAPQFFTECYGIRSGLVHGAEPRPSRDEVSARAAELERFVGHLISAPLLQAIE